MGSTGLVSCASFVIARIINKDNFFFILLLAFYNVSQRIESGIGPSTYYKQKKLSLSIILAIMKGTHKTRPVLPI